MSYEIVEESQANLRDIREKVVQARELLAGLEQDEKLATAELEGLLKWAARMGLGPNSGTGSGDQVPDNVVSLNGEYVPDEPAFADLSLATRSDAVMHVLESSEVSLDRSAIAAMLVNHERFESLDAISLTLTGLKRQGRADQVTRGQWRALSPSLGTGS